jgi:hypothetical protein
MKRWLTILGALALGAAALAVWLWFAAPITDAPPPTDWCDLGDTGHGDSARWRRVIARAKGSERPAQRCAGGFELVSLGLSKLTIRTEAQPTEWDRTLRQLTHDSAVACQSANDSYSILRGDLLTALLQMWLEPSGPGATRLAEIARGTQGRAAIDAALFAGLAAAAVAQAKLSADLLGDAARLSETETDFLHWEKARVFFELARAYDRLHQPDRAYEAVTRARSVAVEGSGATEGMRVCLTMHQARYAAAQDDNDMAVAHCAEALQSVTETKIPDAERWSLAAWCAGAWMRDGKTDEGVARFEAAVAECRAKAGEATLCFELQDEFGRELFSSGRYEQAARVYAELTAAGREALPDANPRLATWLVDLGNARLLAGDVPGAPAAHEEALAIHAKLAKENDALMGRQLLRLAERYEQAGQRDIALDYARRAGAAWASVFPQGHPDRQQVQAVIERLEK